MTKTPRARGELRQVLDHLLTRPEGMTARDGIPFVASHNSDDSWSRLQKMALRGEVFAGTKPGVIKRYFATAEARDAWLASGRGEFRPEPEQRQGLTVARNRKPAQKRVIGGAITTDRTVWTIDDTPRPTAAWQVLELAPDPRWPSFAATRPGVNPDTGKAWGSRA